MRTKQRDGRHEPTDAEEMIPSSRYNDFGIVRVKALMKAWSSGLEKAILPSVMFNVKDLTPRESAMNSR